MNKEETITYDPDAFANLSDSDLGRQIWAFLMQPESITRLETASELGKPAVEGIEESLLATFGEAILVGRVKQMIGHMTKQILAHRGWVLDQENVKVHSVPFIKATRYKRPHWITLHAYRNARDPRDVAITSIRSNPRLPSGTTWTYYATFASPLKAAVAFGIKDLAGTKAEIRDQGYHRVHVERMLRRA